MISKKVFTADGLTARYLSDFIIRSEQFARVYCFVYSTYETPGTLQDPNSPWAFPGNLYYRDDNVAASDDLITIDKWDVVDNSVLFYSEPKSGSTIYLEVATTPEEFGDTLVQPSVEAAEAAAAAALASQLAAENAELNAGTSATDAAQSAYDSGQAASSAFTSASDAALSETNAGISSANASTSATNAATSETNAAASAATATTQATQAGDSALAAASSAFDADVSATQAGYSETNAATSEANAAASEVAAAASAAEAASIIESGVSGDVMWTKFGDGTLIQAGRVTIASVSTTIANGALWRSASSSIQISYPIPFINTLKLGISIGALVKVKFISVQPYSTSTTGFSAIANATANETHSDVTFQFTAVGRWKAA